MWFVGVPVAFAAGTPDVVPAGVDVVATRPGDRHVTLVFLGSVPAETVMRIWGSLPDLALPQQAHPVKWELFGRSAVALAVTDDDGLLRSAAEACHDAAERLIELKGPSEFRPHVTLARAPRRSRPPSRQALRHWALPSGPLDVGHLTLFRSRQGGTGDRYEVVERKDGAA